MATKAVAGKNKPRKADDRSVMNRVKRAENAQARKLAAAMGLEGVTNAQDLEDKMQNLQAEREKNMTDSERNASRVTQLQDQLKQAQTDLSRYKRAYTDAKSKQAELQGQVESLKDDYETLEAEVTIKDAAQAAGVTDFDYAMHLFRGYCLSEGEEAQFGEDPKGYFEDIKKQNRHLHIFENKTVAAGPTSAQKAEAESQPGASEATPPPDLPPQPAPAPKSAGGQLTPPSGSSSGDPEDVTDMDKAAFQKRTEDMYGFRPSR